MNLLGKTALVTGAGGAIGRATALRLAQAGADLSLVDWNAETVQQTADQIIALGRRAFAATADVRDRDRIPKIVEETIQTLGSLDILVNNAGGSARLIGKSTLFAQSEPETWDWTIGVNLLGPMLLIHAALPHMMARDSGKIVNVGSVAGVNGLRGLADYSAAKGGIIALTRALALELGEYRINVNCVSPGSIGLRPGQPLTYLGRIGMPEEVAHLIAFLASEEADFITGQNYLIDGGRCLSTNCSPDVPRI
ncbi:MAG TPA: SDR family NAD(P)-dependent oxidoreductase [Clostridia bacterium]|nr:SDR family NAD(P)-dependent oxidoreductase [Clostridia bacterium]